MTNARTTRQAADASDLIGTLLSNAEVIHKAVSQLSRDVKR
jgi:hypothetical protein